jgi:hypothetical protein
MGRFGAVCAIRRESVKSCQKKENGQDGQDGKRFGV